MLVTREMYREFVAKLFHRTGQLEKDFAHAILGITTEMGELLHAHHAKDKVNLLEEAGDMLFFCTAAAMVLRDYAKESLLEFDDEVHEVFGTTREAILGTDATVFIAGLLSVPAFGHVASMIHDDPKVPDEAVTRLQNMAKGWVGYDKKPDAAEVAAALGSLLVPAVGAIAFILEEDEAPNEAAQRAVTANIAKLQHRYPGGFSVESATTRDLEGERSAVESAVSQ